MGQESVVNRCANSPHSVQISHLRCQGPSTQEKILSDHPQQCTVLPRCCLSGSPWRLAWHQRSSGSMPFEYAVGGSTSQTHTGSNSTLLHVWNFILSKISPICSIGSLKKHTRQLLQHCSVSDLTWWSLTLKQKCSPDLDLHVNIYIYIYIHMDMHVLYVSICICMYMYVSYLYFISFISLSMSETNIRPCIALCKIALYRNVALLLVPLHPVLKTIYLEIEIRAHKPWLPALIVMKNCY